MRNPLITFAYLKPIYPASRNRGFFVYTTLIIGEKDMSRFRPAFWVPRDCCDTYLVHLLIIVPKILLYNIIAAYLIIVIKDEDHHQQAREELHAPEGTVPPLWH